MSKTIPLRIDLPFPSDISEREEWHAKAENNLTQSRTKHSSFRSDRKDHL
jgi:hypothetical protein